jgi:aspartyl-tRNA(Asn)/glutamyl-tRNA(Gln) amidotransferase subunit B
MRSKETEADYRYFREPDLLPIRINPMWQDEILSQLPELPLERRQRFTEQYGLPLYDAEILTEERSLSNYFEAAVGAYRGEPKIVSNWLMNDVLRMIRERGVPAADLALRPSHLVEIIQMVEDHTITTNTGKALLERVEQSGQSPAEIVKQDGLAQVSDEEMLRDLLSGIMASNPEQVEAYRKGKTTLLGWFVGQAMRETEGKANPQVAKALLEELLNN